MHISMKRHATRPNSRFLQFYLRTPKAMLPQMLGRRIVVELPAQDGDAEAVFEAKVGQFIRGALGTLNPTVADRRHLRVREHIVGLIAAVKHGPVTLTPRQIHGLAGQVYRLLEEEHADGHGTEAEWSAFKGFLRAAIEGRIPSAPPIPVRGRSDDAVMAEALFGETDDLTGAINSLPASGNRRALEERVGRLALWVLGRNGIEVAPETHVVLLREIARAALQFGYQAKRQASGDFRPDPDRDRFPDFDKAKEKGVTLWGLFAQWQKERKPSPSSVSTWRGAIRSLEEFLGQDIEAAKLTRAQVIGWKDALVDAGREPAAINDHYFAALNALLNVGVTNDRPGQPPLKWSALWYGF